MNLGINDWKDLLNILIQGTIGLSTVLVVPWLGYKTIIEKAKINKARENIISKEAEIDKFEKTFKVAKSTVKFYQRENQALRENLFNIQIRTEVALEFVERSSTTAKKLNIDLIERTHPAVINHLSSLRDQIYYQKKQLESYYNLFQEILIFAVKNKS